MTYLKKSWSLQTVMPKSQIKNVLIDTLSASWLMKIQIETPASKNYKMLVILIVLCKIFDLFTFHKLFSFLAS